MCIVFFEWTDDRFLVCHNRDEFFARPTDSTKWWLPDSTSDDNDNGDGDDGFEILAPRDAVSGGTWFGFEKTTGRCAFLTNIRELDSTKYNTSRGELVVNYLKSDKRLSALEYLRAEFGGNDCGAAAPSGTAPNQYGGFNLVVFSGHDLAYFSNRYADDQVQRGPIALSMGIPYGLSNSVLQEPYAKVRAGLEIFEEVLDGTRRRPGSSREEENDNDRRLMDGLERLMQRQEYYPGDPLPRTGKPGFPESVVRQRSSICVPSADGYGTRTLIRFFLERTVGEKTDDGQLPLGDTPQLRRLRCAETNLNHETLQWDTNTDVNCLVSVR